jgi:hypothetical protein
MAQIIKVIYSSPAIPQYPYDVKVGVIYDCIKSDDKYSIKSNNFERVFNFDFIKKIFKPCEGYSWDMLDNNEKTEIITNKKAKSKKTKVDKELI